MKSPRSSITAWLLPISGQTITSVPLNSLRLLLNWVSEMSLIPAYMLFLLRQQRFNEIKAILAAFYQNSPNPPLWLIESADTLFRPGNRDEALQRIIQAKQEESFSMPPIEFGLWLLVGGVDQAYETFNTMREIAPHYLQMEFIFSAEGAEFRQDSRFKQAY